MPWDGADANLFHFPQKMTCGLAPALSAAYVQQLEGRSGGGTNTSLHMPEHIVQQPKLLSRGSETPALPPRSFYSQVNESSVMVDCKCLFILCHPQNDNSFHGNLRSARLDHAKPALRQGKCTTNNHPISQVATTWFSLGKSRKSGLSSGFLQVY